MDGCSATQKSQYFLGAMAVLALTGRLDVVEIFCMVPGHTKFDSDIICQKIAAKYNASDTYNHGMLNGIVKLYATAHAYDGDSLMTFKRATPGIFSPVDGITNYRSFLIVGDDGRMDDDLPGVALPDEDAVGADAAAPPAPPAYPDELLRAAVTRLKERSLEVVLPWLAEGKPFSGLGSGCQVHDISGPVCGMPFRRVRLFKRHTESDEAWVEQLGYQLTLDAVEIGASLALARSFSSLPESETAKLKPYYGNKAKDIMDQYQEYIPHKYVPDEYILAAGGPSGTLSVDGLSAMLSDGDVRRNEDDAAAAKAAAAAKEQLATDAKAARAAPRTFNVRVRVGGAVPPGLPAPHAVATCPPSGRRSNPVAKRPSAKKPAAKKPAAQKRGAK